MSNEKDNVSLNPSEDLTQALDKAMQDEEQVKEEKPEAPAQETVPAAELVEEEEQPAETARAEQEKPEPKDVAPKYEPPAEFNGEEKAAFRKMAPKAQEATLRIHKARTAEISRMQNEYRGIRDLAKVVSPYLEAAGMQGKDPNKAIMEAVALTQALNRNPEKALREIARIKGIDLGKPEAAKEAQTESPEIGALKDTVAQLQSRQAKEDFTRAAQAYGSVFSSLQAEKNAAGSTRFPDLTNDEAGIRLAGQIGSLIRQPNFQAAVKSRIPDAGLRELVVEAYRWQGGRVVDHSNPVRSPQETQAHVTKARRAAASVPGHGAVSSRQMQKGKAKDLSSAVEMALEEMGFE